MNAQTEIKRIGELIEYGMTDSELDAECQKVSWFLRVSAVAVKEAALDYHAWCLISRLGP